MEGWVLIALVAILVGGFKEVFEIRSKSKKLGRSTDDLERQVAALEERLDATEKERKALVRRLQNLETITTSQAWDALHEHEPGRLEAPPEQAGDAAPSDAQKAEQLAQRLQA